MSQRHATDVVSLVFGTIFAGFTAVWLLALTLDLHGGDAWWAGPLVLVVAGGAGLVVSLRGSRDGDRPADVGIPPEDLST